MAYIPYYTANFTNEQSQTVEITISRKDGDPDTEVVNFEVTACTTSDKSEGQTKYECTIIIREMQLGLWVTDAEPITWETFIDAEHDTWFVEYAIDGQKYFEGFITPDEGNAMLQDKPYEVTLRATNGLGLLKDISLVDVDGDDFVGDNTLIKYIAGALKQTKLSLPIRIYCGYFHLSMLNKGDGLEKDMFNQAYLNYRTFRKEATTFVSCYEALRIIFDKFCTLEYWNGMWLIMNIAEKQYIPGDRFYVDYDANGDNPVGAIDANNYGQIGKSVDIYPINEDPQIYSRFAIKSAKTTYNYEVWPELPTNNKFDRGTLFETGNQADVYDGDRDGNTSEIIGTYKKYTINDWTTGRMDFTPTEFAALPNFSTPNPDQVYRKSVISPYGPELYREIVIVNGAASGERWLQSDGIPVSQGDKFELSFDWRFESAIGAVTPAICSLYIVTASGAKYALCQDVSTPGEIPKWELQVSHLFKHLYTDRNATSQTDFSSFNLTVDKFPPIPVDGTMYIAIVHAEFGSNTMYIRSFEFKYFPYIANSYVEVKSDYWLRTQTGTYLDVAEDEVFISDAQKRVLKGALIFKNGSVDALTSPTWYRYNEVGNGNPTSEAKHFKELLNIARFNHSYRRMYAIEGSFNGLNWAPENNQLNKYPIGFYWMYREVDLPEQRDFVFVPPLKMDGITGWIQGNLVEVRKVADGDADGTQTGTAIFNYLF